MIKPTNILEKISPSYARVKRTPDKTLSRLHHINFLKESEKFISSTDKFEDYMKNLSLKVVPQFFKSVYHIGKMASEKLKSVYYFQK